MRNILKHAAGWNGFEFTEHIVSNNFPHFSTLKKNSENFTHLSYIGVLKMKVKFHATLFVQRLCILAIFFKMYFQMYNCNSVNK